MKQAEKSHQYGNLLQILFVYFADSYLTSINQFVGRTVSVSELPGQVTVENRIIVSKRKMTTANYQ